MITRFFTFSSATVLVACSAFVLSACQDNKNPTKSSDQTAKTASAAPTNDAPSALVGCYTISQSEPAQIKINQDGDNFTMQMKESKGKASVWDKPQAVNTIDIDKGWEYFKVNTLDLNKDDVATIIARPDGMMALAEVKDTAKNINPRLDSPYVMYIVQGSNTVYQVPCDDTPLDMDNVGTK